MHPDIPSERCKLHIIKMRAMEAEMKRLKTDSWN